MCNLQSVIIQEGGVGLDGYLDGFMGEPIVPSSTYRRFQWVSFRNCAS